MVSFFVVCAIGLALCSISAMMPMRPVRLALGVLLSEDPLTLAPATDANKVALVLAPFTLQENLVPADFTLGTADGLAPILCATGAQEVALLPSSAQQIITIKPAAGTGFRWVSSGTFPPPVIVYGFALLTNDLATVLAAQTLPTPLTITDAGQQVDLDPVTMTFVQSPVY